MIPEEEHDKISEDEISIDVPSGSPVSSVIVNESMESLTTSRVDSIYSSTETLDSYNVEKEIEMTSEDDNSACSEQSNSGSNEGENEIETDKQVATEQEVPLSDYSRHITTEGNINLSETLKHIDQQSSLIEHPGEEMHSERVCNEQDANSHNYQEKDLNQSEYTEAENDRQLHVAESKKDVNNDHEPFDEHSLSMDSKINEINDTCSSDNTERTCSVSSNESKHTESDVGTRRDSFLGDHWEEISIDSNVLNEVIENINDSDAEIAIEVVKADKEIQMGKLNASNSYDELSESKEISEKNTEIYAKSKKADSISFKSLNNADNKDKVTDMSALSKSMPCILVTQDDHSDETQRHINNKDYAVKESKELNNDTTDRGMSVSDVVLDPKSTSPMPVTANEENLEENENNGEIEAVTQSELMNSSEIVTVPVPLSAFGEDAEKAVDNKEIADAYATAVKTSDVLETSDGRTLTPNSDVEYDYNVRRGSQVKIKLAGRRRQRLSIGDIEQPISPTEFKQSDDEGNDSNSTVSMSGPLLEKRDKMEKVSFKTRSEKRDTISPAHSLTYNTIVDISENNTNKIHYYNAQTNTSEISKSPKKPRNVENINSLNAELIAIYNSSTPSESKEQANRQQRHNKIAQTERNEEDYHEGYHLLKSCDQSHATQLFVTDINQMIVKTRNPPESDIGRLQQDFNCDNTSNKSNTDTKHDKKNNSETKSHLLPNCNETGNCEIKAPEKCAIEHDTLSHKCEQGQLSLRQNGHKNNEINEPESSIEQSPSHDKQYKSKSLRKRQAYEDLYSSKSVSTPSVKSSQVKLETKVARELNTGKQSLVPPGRDIRLKTSKTCSKQDRSEKESSKTQDSSTNVSLQCTKSKAKRFLEKSKTGTRNIEMSARIHRPRDELAEMAGFPNREMSGRLQRTQSSLTDTARLKSIRKLLNLTDENEDKLEQNAESDREKESIIHDIIEGVITNVCSQRNRHFETVMKTHRCVTSDDDGEEMLCCLLQTSCNDVDPSKFTCDVIDPVDVCPITRKHEHLISNIVRISSTVFQEFSPAELVVSIPIAHWYVEKWQELVIRQQDGNGHWKDAGSDTAEVFKIDDVSRVYYGVRHILSETCTLAVVCRPRVTSVTMTKHNFVVNSVIDDRVKMHVFSSAEQKPVNMQVVPVDQSVLADFCEKEENKKACMIVASSPLVQIYIDGDEPESLAFDVPYESVSPRRPDVKSNRNCSPYLRAPDHGLNQSLLSPNLSPAQSPRRLSLASPFVKDMSQRAFHLAQIDEEDAVRVKLLGKNDSTAIDIVTGQIEENNATDEQTVRFSVYDKTARLVALETRGSLEYSNVEKVTRSFVNFIVKHKVTLSISQDPRNVYSILFSAMVNHPHRDKNHTTNQAYRYFTTSYRKEIQIHEGDVVAIAFRGNVDVPDREQLIYSFHGCRGIRRHFDIQVSNPMSQRSLQTYHGALQLFTLKSPRYSGLDRTLAPCNKNGWELSAEFPLLLPKYLKSTPVIINKAPVSLRFHEPLTVDFIKTICFELVNEWTQFAKALGISHARVQAIKQQHRNQVSEKVLMDVIINWMKTQRISQDKVTPLIYALRICNRQKLASELTHRFSAQKVNRSKTARDKSLQKAFSVISKSSSVIAKWRQLLHHLCKDGGNHVIDLTKEIDEKYSDEATKCQNALLHWKTTTAEPSVWKLVDALRANRCNIVADTIVTMESKKK